MINLIKKLFYKIFGTKKALKLISRAYLKLFFTGTIKKNAADKHFLTTIIKQGFYCIDIGANVGYYTIPLSRLVGDQGKVFAIEPVPMFLDILRDNLKHYNCTNVEILPYALGQTDGEQLTMGTPEVKGVFRHGLTKVLSPEETTNHAYTHKVEMYSPATLFKNIPRLDYIKIDVEGYEESIIPDLLPLLQKYRPIIQIETQSQKVFETLINENFIPYKMSSPSHELTSITRLNDQPGDLYLFPA